MHVHVSFCRRTAWRRRASPTPGLHQGPVCVAVCVIVCVCVLQLCAKGGCPTHVSRLQFVSNAAKRPEMLMSQTSCRRSPCRARLCIACQCPKITKVRSTLHKTHTLPGIITPPPLRMGSPPPCRARQHGKILTANNTIHKTHAPTSFDG